MSAYSIKEDADRVVKLAGAWHDARTNPEVTTLEDMDDAVRELSQAVMKMRTSIAENQDLTRRYTPQHTAQPGSTAP